MIIDKIDPHPEPHPLQNIGQWLHYEEVKEIEGLLTICETIFYTKEAYVKRIEKGSCNVV